MTRIWKGKRILSLALALILLMTSVNLPAPIFAANEEQTASDTTEQKDPMIGKQVKFNTDYPQVWTDKTNPYSKVLATASKLPNVMVIVDVYQYGASTILYQLDAAEGYTWPAGYPVADFAGKYWIESTKVTILEPCDKCGKIECGSSHENWCDICKVDNCTNKHLEATVTDSQGKEQKITVTGDLPDGATLSVTVPKINGEALPNVYDIKVYDKDGNEWQPIDEGKTVTISLPVPGAPDDAQAIVTHFIDYAKDINGDEEFVSVDGLEGSALTLLQSAIAACTKQGCVAVETTKGIVTNGVVTIETDSFSVYTPEYVEQNKTNGVFSVNFKSYTEIADPSNEKTYYATIGEEIKFTFEYSGSKVIGGLIDIYQKGKYSLTRLSDGAVLLDQDRAEYTESESGNWFSSTVTYNEFITYTFTKEGLGLTEDPKVGEIFEIRWHSQKTISPKGDRWTRIMIVEAYLTKFNANGGKFSDEKTEIEQTIVSYQPVSAFAVPTREGYIFKGWAFSKDATGEQIYKVTDNFPGVMVANSTLYAQWEPVEYTVTYVLPEGVENSSSFVTQTKYQDQPLLLHDFLPIDLDANTKFQGWDITGDGVVDIDRYAIIAGYWYTGNADLNVVGIWDDAVLAVIYDANGGTGAPDTHYSYKKDGYQATVSSIIPTRNGYKFDGWKDASGKLYEGNTIVNLGSSNLVLYAKWKPLYYAIQFNSNGATGSMGEMLALTYDNLTAERYYTNYYANLLANAFTRENSNFMGWAITQADANNGIVHFQNGENVKMSNLVDLLNSRGIATYEADKTVNHNNEDNSYPHQVITLYAVWAQKTYTIYYTTDAADASISNLTQTVIYEENGGTSATINSVAQRSRYTFAGWRDNRGNVYAYGDPVPSSDGEDVVLTATWQFNVIGYMFSMISDAPVQNGSILVNGENMGSRYVLSFTDSGNVPEMTFKPDEGYEILCVYIEDVVYTKDNPGNYLVFSADGSCTYIGMTNCSEPLYIAVQTQPKTYTVTWTDWDNAILHRDQNVIHGTTPIYPGSTPTREDGAHEKYVFTGWEPSIVPVTGDVTYKATYAVVLDKYVVTWIVDGVTVRTDEVEYGYTVKAPGTYEKDGFTFVGWNTNENGEGTAYAAGEFMTVIAPVELYAQWKQDSTTLTIYVNFAGDYAIDGEQSFLFDVTGEGVQLTVAVLQNGQVMIDGLTIGKTYTITLRDNWSWRYGVAANGIVCENVEATEVKASSVQFVLGTGGKVTFTMNRTNDQWLDGNAYSKN